MFASTKNGRLIAEAFSGWPYGLFIGSYLDKMLDDDWFFSLIFIHKVQKSETTWENPLILQCSYICFDCLK